MYELLDAKRYLGTHGGWTIPTTVKLKMTAKLIMKKIPNKSTRRIPTINLLFNLKTSYLYIHVSLVHGIRSKIQSRYLYLIVTAVC